MWRNFAIGCADSIAFRLASDSPHLYIRLWMIVIAGAISGPHARPAPDQEASR